MRVTCREINKGGLPMLYEIILEIAGPEIKCALEVICGRCVTYEWLSVAAVVGWSWCVAGWRMRVINMHT